MIGFPKPQGSLSQRFRSQITAEKSKKTLTKYNVDSAYTLKWIFFFTPSILPWSSCWWSMSNWHILLAQSIFSSIRGNTLSEVADLEVASNGCHMGTPTLQEAINTRSYKEIGKKRGAFRKNSCFGEIIANTEQILENPKQRTKSHVIHCTEHQLLKLSNRFQQQNSVSKDNLIFIILSKPIETTRYPVWLPKCGNITRLTLSILTHDKPKMDNSTWMRDSTTFVSALIYLISRSCEILNENWMNDWKKPSMVSGVPFHVSPQYISIDFVRRP